jgi:hypothetical protein
VELLRILFIRQADINYTTKDILILKIDSFVVHHLTARVSSLTSLTMARGGSRDSIDGWRRASVITDKPYYGQG